MDINREALIPKSIGFLKQAIIELIRLKHGQEGGRLIEALVEFPENQGIAGIA